MDEPPLVLAGPGDVVAMVPHVIGARPDGSVVVFPLDPQRPVARADIPTTSENDGDVAQGLATSFERFTGGQVLVLAFTDRLERATSVCDAVAAALEPETTVVDRIAAQGDSWLRLDDTRPETINQGTITQADRDRVAVAFIGRGDRQPYDSLSQLRASFDPVDEDLSAAVTASAERMNLVGGWAPAAAVEQRWMTHRIEAFVARPVPLGADDAARLIGDVQIVPLRDHALGLMTHEESGAHAALWKDLLTRSPEDACTPVANLAAFGAWLHGDGMGARLALERVTDPANSLARLLDTAVERGLDPAGWTPPVTEPIDVQQRPGGTPNRHDPRREPPPHEGPDRKRPPR
ncbi:DUF4192 domain-containing protein [Flexivirga alba]|uniref:DUF4192 domain-containing protein n=1 Tax=Flexivirga alba TaxID=702742 RepID=A0ABW2AIE2_9MICO